MRTLAAKLTLAFVVVGVLGVVLFALLLARRTSVEVRRYLSERDQEVLVDLLGEYYDERESWEGVQAFLVSRPALGRYSHDAVLADTSGRVLFAGPGRPSGGQLSEEEMAEAVEVMDDDRAVGFLSLPGEFRRNGQRPEEDFLQRMVWAAIASAAATIGVALVVGGLLARTLTRPVTALTEATRAMAAGDLHQQVAVQTQDEIGELARSFNQMSADLAQASTMRKQMTADLAHELRTPLTILGGYAEGLREARVESSPELFALMHDEVLHLQRLVEDLRVLSLADAGELPLNRRGVDASALLERAYLANAGRAGELGIALHLEAADSLPSVSVDTDRMAQVLNNLVGNALRHSSSGGVTLRGRALAREVVLEVEDTGSGIAAEDLAFVFERFYRGDKSRHRDDADSSGLGLAIARAIVESHGGAIGVDSVEGSGSTFWIRLPQA